MKTLFLLLSYPILCSFTWTYLTSENGKAGPRIKLKEQSKTFKFSDRKCTIEDTVKPREGTETRALICDIAEGTQVMSTAVCSATEKNLADLSFISEKAVVSVIVYCN